MNRRIEEMIRMLKLVAGMGVAIAIIMAVASISGCEGEPPHCPPPIGCAR